MNDTDLTHLETLLAAATPGPWEYEFNGRFDLHPRVMGSDGKDRLCIASTIGTKTTRDKLDLIDKQNNAQLIIALRNAAPALIARVRELEAEKDHWETLQQEGSEG